ncbi:MAG: extracellular solute-binding protein [Paenibacillaceae bacterium]|nr:extracellular solute-binding protein [Paenibacillaceae bacterium]
MKMWQTRLSLAAVLLLASIASACSSDGTKQTAVSAKPGNSASAAPSGSAKPKEVPKVYIYANAGSMNAGIVSTPAALEEVRQAIIEKAGVDPQAIIPPKGTEQEKLNVLLASNEPLDVFLGSTADFQAKGAIQPINELLDKYGGNIKKLWPTTWADTWGAVSTPDGKIWGVPQLPALSGNTVYLRTDWLAKVGLSMPKTIDELENVLKTFKEKDPAGSGQTIPLIADLSGLNNALSAGFTDQGYGNWVDADKKIKPPVLQPGYKEFVAKMAEWYQKGYLYKEAFSIKADQMKELIKQNRVGTASTWYTNVTSQIPALKTNQPAAAYEVAKDLRGPKGYVTTSGSFYRNGTMIAKNSKNAEAAIKLINWVDADIENYFLVYFGIKNKHWKYVDESKHTIELINQDYRGEFLIGSSFAYTVQFTITTGNAPTYDFDYIRDYITNTSRVKPTGDATVAYKYDNNAINQQVTTRADLDRMMTEEITKFIMGARPMSEYDAFIEQLNKAGLDKWIAAYSAEYAKVSGK